MLNKTAPFMLAVAFLALAAADAADAQAMPPANASCPLGYDPSALANVCLLPFAVAHESRTICLVGDLCIEVPVILYDNGQPPPVVYFDAFCAVESTECACSELLDGLAFACTPLQSSGAPTFEPAEGRDDNTLLIQDGDNCLPTTYEEEAFANVCIVVGPEWGSGIATAAGDQICIVGDACTPTIVAFTDGDGVPWPVAAYVEALCNLPSGCGCGFYAQRLVLLCSPIQG